MSRIVVLPPESDLRPDGTKAGGWWHSLADSDRIVCDLCPRACALKPGDRGFCFVRENRGGEMVLSTYGRSTGFCVDPIEKKPLNHFYPGTSVLSFGTAGCNLGCKFCQNWSISKSREIEKLSELATPEAIAEAARSLECRSVAFTYNDPVVWAEYAIDVARACRAAGIKTVAVTAGYITPLARGPFYEVMDAANVDLKGFTESFYQHLTLSHLAPVLDTLKWLKRETAVWFEITNLVIPQANDSMDEIGQMCDWILDELGDEVPLHFTAFHPDFRLRDRPRTPSDTLVAAHEVARRRGLKYAYVGNVDDARRQSTYCPGCGQVVVERNWYELGAYRLRDGACLACGHRVAGHFDAAPGDWGRKRLPVDMSRFARSLPIVNLPQGTPQMTAAKMSTAKMSTASPPNESKPVIAPLQFTPDQERQIHRAACELVASAVQSRPAREEFMELGSLGATIVLGVFVSLKRRGRLRSCCGAWAQPQPLGQALQQAAIQSATRDARLPSISPTELAYLDLEAWLLHGGQLIAAQAEDRLAEVVVGRDGLAISRGASGGLLLPSVPVENHWTAEEFLEHVSIKAGLPPSAWKEVDTQLVKFSGHAIGGPFDKLAIDATLPPAGPLVGPAELVELAKFCRQNIAALVVGATPNYYLPGGPDGNVQGVVLGVRIEGRAEIAQFGQIDFRPGLPLQATLFALAQSAAGALQNARLDERALANLQVELAVLSDPAMHGTVSEPDWDGLDLNRRALLAVERDKMAWRFDPQQTPADMLGELAREISVTNPDDSAVYSLTVQTTQTPAAFAILPKARLGPAVRPPAVAGTFYPADPAELSSLVDELLANESEPQQRCRAVLVPHAGLRYSGRIAATVLGRIEIPDTVIVLGPKHTRSGVEWAVAPHGTWSMPGFEVQSDPGLARRLVAAIPGLQLDAAAHAQEHAIEVELPLLARLAPQARVLGIAVGAGNPERCRTFAAGLAEVLSNRKDRVLLVVSSDMNHFASDRETRRVDELALAALERGEPSEFYQTIQRHHISMCGALPALIVWETLRLLDANGRFKRVAYATTADVTGDESRVVGYAGMIFQ